ncbi:hypothetical protein FPY71_07275 [Aureimonas fodinaquatilis]|uniref:Uncharacterized protein n=1 Tax=Aureimonas fodinaquatilis TaxID=2565783 RepID=A0A5B0DVE9_9HYPH|nr:hypothetical protein [Aureimonas fodinaquatilis]KAA0970318.1 hypothetical protein FPY71_07275 [Aureimonas fodinaquatilis]
MAEIKYFASFDNNGFPTAYYWGEMWPVVPANTVEISEAHYLEFINNSGARVWDGEKPVVYEPPAPDPEPIRIPAATFFDRLTEDEADQLDDAMMTKTVKFRRAWQAATSFDEDSDLWPVMRAEMVDLFGEPRTAELLTL